MSNEAENSSPQPPAGGAGEPTSTGQTPPSAGSDQRRHSRFRDEPRSESSSRAQQGGEYKPSESGSRREGGGEHRRRDRDREPGGSGSGDRRGPRSGGGGGGRRSEPDSRRSGGGRPERRDGRDRNKTPDAAPKPEAAPAAVKESKGTKAKPPETFLEELGGSLLESVSRSFALTIKALPPGVREPITAGYLLARTLDTIADTNAVPVEKRLEHLRALLEMIKTGLDPELTGPLQKDLAAKQTDEGERELIKKLPRCIAWLEALPAEDRWDLRRTLSRIGRGQELDLLRFGKGTAAEPKALATVEELDEYTYFVAGCVGELWTRLSARYLPGEWSKLPVDEMLKLGKNFGQGLQLVNILRDLPADLKDGRCYLPETLLAGQDLKAETVAEAPAKAKPILDDLRQQAVAKLDDAWKYARALTPLKLRYACSLPVLIGFETLGLLAKTSPLETSERVKMPKSGVRGLMFSSAIGSAVGPWHERQYRSARARAVGRS